MTSHARDLGLQFALIYSSVMREIYIHVHLISPSALHWILAPEVESPSLPVKIVEDVLASEGHLAAPDKPAYLKAVLAVSPQEIIAVAQQTLGQRTNVLWSVARKHRITASNFGMVLHATRTKRLFGCLICHVICTIWQVAFNFDRFTNSLKKRLLSSYNLEAVRSIAWGINNEDRAIADYMSLGAVVEHTGAKLDYDLEYPDNCLVRYI